MALTLRTPCQCNASGLSVRFSTFSRTGWPSLTRTTGGRALPSKHQTGVSGAGSDRNRARPGAAGRAAGSGCAGDAAPLPGGLGAWARAASGTSPKAAAVARRLRRDGEPARESVGGTGRDGGMGSRLRLATGSLHSGVSAPAPQG